MLMHMLHVNEYDGNLVRQMFSIQLAAAALHVKNGTSILPTIHTENTDQLCLGLCFFIRRWTLRTNVCGVRSGEAGCHLDLSYM